MTCLPKFGTGRRIVVTGVVCVCVPMPPQHYGYVLSHRQNLTVIVISLFGRKKSIDFVAGESFQIENLARCLVQKMYWFERYIKSERGRDIHSFSKIEWRM